MSTIEIATILCEMVLAGVTIWLLIVAFQVAEEMKRERERNER